MAERLVKLRIRKLPEGVYLATSSELPGLVVQADTIAETLDIATDVAQKLFEAYLEHGDSLPECFVRDVPDRFDTRIVVEC